MTRSRPISLLGLLLFLCLVLSLAWADPPYSQTIGTNSVKVIAARGIPTATAFATNTVYRQGRYVEYSNRVYMAVNAGTSGTTPPVHVGGEASDGAVTWRRCYEAPRNGLVLCLTTNAPVYLTMGALPAETGKGIPLLVKGASFCPPSGKDGLPYQGEISAISSGTNAPVAIQEW